MNPPKRDGISAVRIMVIAFGIWCGTSGLEHGFFEVLQGNTVPETHLISGRPMIYAIGEANRFWKYGVEYAYTIVPNFLVSGTLAMAIGLLVIVWCVGFVQKKYGWLVFVLLSILQYCVGGGAAQIGPAILTGLLAIGINKPPKWWRALLPTKAREVLAAPWLWLVISLLFVCCNATVTAVFGWFYGFKSSELILKVQWTMLYILIGLFLLSGVSVLSKDSLASIDQNS